MRTGIRLHGINRFVFIDGTDIVTLDSHTFCLGIRDYINNAILTVELGTGVAGDLQHKHTSWCVMDESETTLLRRAYCHRLATNNVAS